MDITSLINNLPMNPVHYDKEPKENLPYVTHEGVLKIGNIEIQVVQLSNGMRILPEGELEKLFGLEDHQ